MVTEVEADDELDELDDDEDDELDPPPMELP